MYCRGDKIHHFQLRKLDIFKEQHQMQHLTTRNIHKGKNVVTYCSRYFSCINLHDMKGEVTIRNKTARSQRTVYIGTKDFFFTYFENIVPNQVISLYIAALSSLIRNNTELQWNVLIPLLHRPLPFSKVMLILFSHGWLNQASPGPMHQVNGSDQSRWIYSRKKCHDLCI